MLERENLSENVLSTVGYESILAKNDNRQTMIYRINQIDKF